MPEDAKPAFDPQAVIDAVAPLAGLVVDPAWRPGVVQNLLVMRAMAETMAAAPVDDREEPAAVFRP